MDNSLLYKIGLGMIPGIGTITARHLLTYCGSAEEIFKQSKAALLKIPKIGEVTANAIINQQVLPDAEREVEFIQKYKIDYHFITDASYPHRLFQCSDAPLFLFYKGNIDLERQKIVSIVGTRKATQYGQDITREIVAQLKPHDPIIVSGLAYGIDIAAHRAALQEGLDTIAVLGHGLSMLYPQEHIQTAREITHHGALITECTLKTPVDRNSFLRRNRIIAGLADLTIVVETQSFGGALTTAERAMQYRRPIFAVPGRNTDEFSKGCNELIRKNKAFLYQSVEDIESIMHWDKDAAAASQSPSAAATLPIDLSPDEAAIIRILRELSTSTPDELCVHLDMNISKLSSLLLSMELKALVESLPGKVYRSKI